MKDTGEVRVEELDWLDTRFRHFKGDQKTLAILKDKGAPINGALHLHADDRYEWERQRQRNYDIFYWRKKA